MERHINKLILFLIFFILVIGDIRDYSTIPAYDGTTPGYGVVCDFIIYQCNSSVSSYRPPNTYYGNNNKSICINANGGIDSVSYIINQQPNARTFCIGPGTYTMLSSIESIVERTTFNSNVNGTIIIGYKTPCNSARRRGFVGAADIPPPFEVVNMHSKKLKY